MCSVYSSSSSGTGDCVSRSSAAMEAVGEEPCVQGLGVSGRVGRASDANGDCCGDLNSSLRRLVLGGSTTAND